MPASLPVRPRWRSAVTTVLLVMISVMIDILVRRWSAGAPPASDLTRHSR